MHKNPILAGLSLEKLTELFSSYPGFRSRQIHKWICSGKETFNEMTNLPVSMQKEMADTYRIYSGTKVTELRDRDGTVKLGIKFDDGIVIEGVILKDGKDRKTACLSTQAGCPLACVFCKTGSLAFKRNLVASEICEQFLRLRKIDPDISHIVIMGMGEPLLNLDELRLAIDYFTDPKGLNISKRRITISTSGIEEGIVGLARNGPDVRLALSLTSARPELREQLMPVTQNNPLPRIKEALMLYQKTFKRRITLEIVILGGINSGSMDVQKTAEFAQGLDVVINLIPWNFVDGMHFEGLPLLAPSNGEIDTFKSALEQCGLKVTTRMGKGQSISGACGQLGSVT